MRSLDQMVNLASRLLDSEHEIRRASVYVEVDFHLIANASMDSGYAMRKSDDSASARREESGRHGYGDCG